VQGTVKNVVIDRGFGFITPHGPGDDLFFHCKSIAPDLAFDEQLKGRRVAYDVEMDQRRGRNHAVNVRAAD
jgi:cold shock CspA family protein